MLSSNMRKRLMNVELDSLKHEMSSSSDASREIYLCLLLEWEEKLNILRAETFEAFQWLSWVDDGMIPGRFDDGWRTGRSSSRESDRSLLDHRFCLKAFACLRLKVLEAFTSKPLGAFKSSHCVSLKVLKYLELPLLVLCLLCRYQVERFQPCQNSTPNQSWTRFLNETRFQYLISIWSLRNFWQAINIGKL